MSDARTLAKGIDAEACLDTLSEMVRHKSYSETEGEKALAARMVEIMTEMGLEASLEPVPGGRFNAIGCWKGTGGGKSLLFNGHLDTNPATEGWTVDPWGGLVDENGKRLKGDVILTYVVGELQGGVGTLAAVKQGVKADYFINSEPSDLQAITMHAAAFLYTIELTGKTRHLSKREEAVDAIRAACDLVPLLTEMTFSDAPSDDHKSINRVHVGTIRGALSREFHEWRAPQVADFVRMTGSGRHGPGQSEAVALEDFRKVLDGLEARWPGLGTEVRIDAADGQPRMPAFEVPKDARIVTALNAAYEAVRGTPQPTGAITPPGFFGTDAGHLYALGGMDGVVCGPGGKYNTMPDERVEIADYLDMIRIYLITMCDICELQ